MHGANGLFPGPLPGVGTNRAGNGILYLYDEKLVSPYANQVTPLRRDGFGNILPAAPRLPVAPGLLYVGEAPGA